MRMTIQDVIDTIITTIPEAPLEDSIDTILYQEKGLIILGHANSEEAGMKWCADWLRSRFPGVSITHLPAGDPFRLV